MRSARFAAALLACAVLLPAAHAQNKNWPPPLSVKDLSDKKWWPADSGWPGSWEMFSFIPESARARVRKAELALGSGIHADRAWQRTTGDRRVVIAVLDSGIRWSERDLVNQYYINPGELPAPDKACRTAAYDPKRPHDANGDGVFNVQDYTSNAGIALPTKPCDPRLTGRKGGWDTNGNGILDPQDLIQIFGDKKDDDGNGYVDDIAGWDFMDNDNDANDDTNFGHGTGEAKDSAAAGNNRIGGIGVCPTCRILPVRVGDSFVVEANDFGMGVVFAVDSGAAVVQEALGSINNSVLAKVAIDYAYKNGVVVIASAADENSYHANFPAANDHTVYTHAVVHDGTRVSTSTTFLNFNNCTNYGPRLELSTPGSGCSSEATGKTSGLAGLIYAAALKANIPFPGGKAGATDKLGARRLTAEEVRQIILTSVDDIDVPESKTDKTKYPSGPGWDQRFGFGRANARKAVDLVMAGKIPPEADIAAPGWFDVLDAGRTPQVTLRGRIAFRKDRYQSMDYVIEWAPGAEPRSGWKTIKSVKGATGPVTGDLATWDISGIQVDNPPMPAPDHGVNRRLVTVRIRVTARSAKLGAVKGVTRKAFQIYRDTGLVKGFPVKLTASGEASPKLVDIDGDGKREIIVATADGLVHVIGPDGKPKNGWPARVSLLPALDAGRLYNARRSHAFKSGAISPDQRSDVMGAPAIGDLDKDGKLEIVVATFDGKIHAFDPTGRPRPGFPVAVAALDLDKVSNRYKPISEGVFAAPVLADLDKDGKLEIVVAAMDGKVYVWRHDGTPQKGFPVLLKVPGGPTGSKARLGRIISSPAVGDVDGDGYPDIVVGSNEELNLFGPLWVVHGRGTAHPSGNAIHKGWPQRIVSLKVLPLVGEGLPNAPALADINGDGLPEIAIGGVGTAAFIYRHNGEKKIPLCFDRTGVDLRSPDMVKFLVRCPRRMTRSCAEEMKADPKVRCVDGAMENKRFGKLSDTKDAPSVVLIANPSFGDLDNDGLVDLVLPMAGFGAAKTFAAGGTRADFDHHVGAWTTARRSYLEGFPRRIDDWQFFANSTVADVDGDGLPEVIQGSGGYWLHAWNHKGKEPAGWPKLTGQWTISSPAVGDLDGDGTLEVVVNTRFGWLYAWRTTAKAKDARIDWESFGHDARNTRNMATKLDQGVQMTPWKKPAPPKKPGGGGTGQTEEGGGCALTAGGRVPLAGLLALLALAVIRRRRR